MYRLGCGIAILVEKPLESIYDLISLATLLRFKDTGVECCRITLGVLIDAFETGRSKMNVTRTKSHPVHEVSGFVGRSRGMAHRGVNGICGAIVCTCKSTGDLLSVRLSMMHRGSSTTYLWILPTFNSADLSNT